MYNDFSMPLFWQKYWPRTVILHIYCNTAPWRVDLPVLVLVEQLVVLLSLRSMTHKTTRRSNITQL